MDGRSASFFRHFPVASEHEAWGLTITAAGGATIAAHAPYPPATYPEDHFLDWSRGRVLDSFHLIWVTEGRGSFRSQEGGRTKVGAGTVVLIPPRVLHWYEPDAEIGWTEAWVQFHGSVPSALLGGKIVSAKPSFCLLRDCPRVTEPLDALWTGLAKSAPGFDPDLSVRLLAVLAAWANSGRSLSAGVTEQALLQAERFLAEHLTEPVNMEELARDLGINYSAFRRLFKAHSGFSPWQYVLQLRLMRARRLLAESEATLDDVAAGLGFNSAFHLSVTFKQAFGLSPSRWRKELRDRAAPNAQSRA